MAQTLQMDESFKHIFFWNLCCIYTELSVNQQNQIYKSLIRAKKYQADISYLE
ncbi:hypothetical protein pb186bvf_008594 [Paramecium bursaria]